MALSDSIVLVIILSSVFGALLLLFSVLVCCCTWRRTSFHRNASHYSNGLSEKQLLHATRVERVTRWSTNKRGRQISSSLSANRMNFGATIDAVTEMGTLRTKGPDVVSSTMNLIDEEKQEQAEALRYLDDDGDARRVEWGATVSADGTRSYLNGWFGLGTPIVSTARSLPLGRRGGYQEERGHASDHDWDVRSISSEEDAETYTYHAARGANTV